MSLRSVPARRRTTREQKRHDRAMVLIRGPYACDNLIAQIHSAGEGSTKDELLALLVASKYHLTELNKYKQEWGPTTDALGSVINERITQAFSDRGM